MFVLANNPKKDDILQLALLQPDDSELYIQATAIVKGDKKKKSWFKWRYENYSETCIGKGQE